MTYVLSITQFILGLLFLQEWDRVNHVLILLNLVSANQFLIMILTVRSALSPWQSKIVPEWNEKKPFRKM